MVVKSHLAHMLKKGGAGSRDNVGGRSTPADYCCVYFRDKAGIQGGQKGWQVGKLPRGKGLWAQVG